MITSAMCLEETLVKNLTFLKTEVESGKFDSGKSFEITFDYRGNLTLQHLWCSGCCAYKRRC